MKNYWTGVGSRTVPSRIQDIQVKIGEAMAKKGYVLRSGNAYGSDINFQQGVYNVDASLTEIWLPWRSYNEELNVDDANYYTQTRRQMKYAEDQLNDRGVMTYLARLTQGAQKMHLRNVGQVIGIACLGVGPPVSKLCVYYAPLDKNGEVMGGTRTAVGMARSYGKPCYNLFVPDECAKICEKLGIEL